MKLFILILNVAFAADTSDLIGTAGRTGAETARGAIANRELSNQLYQRSLANHDAAWSGGIPNVGLLFKALQQSKDAKAADDQAKEFARAALHASNTGAHSGEFINSRYGMADESKLKELSTTSSPYMPQAEKTLGGYGMKLDADKMSLQTPFGKFSTNSEDSTLLKMASSIASKLGYSTAGMEQGQKDAIRERDALAAKIMADLDSGSAADSSREPASESVMPELKAAEEKAIEAKAEAQELAKSDVQNTGYKDWNAEEKALLNSRKAMGRALGLAPVEPMGRATQDIFRMIQLRYQSIESEGSFLSK